MKKMVYLLMILALLMSACDNNELEIENEIQSLSNTISTDKMLLVLSAPDINDRYYSAAINLIVDFQVNYAKAILGKDNVVIIVNSQTRHLYENRVPNDILITADVYDIWMRDFSTVNPESPVQFTYTWASMTKRESEEVQGSFDQFANAIGIDRMHTDLIIDGGNLVDNYNGRVITTTRFLEDNNLNYTEGVARLKQELGATEVAIIAPDEEVLAHADGMVSWSGDNTLLVNDYSSDQNFRAQVITELQNAFRGVKIVEVPVEYSINPPGQWDGLESACGINLNATTTYNNIYVPVFNMPHEEEALRLIADNTSKNIIQINAEGVCAMGGSVRCLTWQLTGQNAKSLILAARNR